MLFPSPVFLSVFLPLVCIVSAVCTKMRAPRLRNMLLTLLSLVFYGWGGGVYTFLLIMSAFVNWLLALGFAGAKRRIRAMLTVLTVVFNIGTLGWYKYSSFVATSVNWLFKALNCTVALPVPNVALPLGISFFTFQAMSYALDVRASTVTPCKNPIKLLMYLALFPQLIAGPILSFEDFEPQTYQLRMNVADLASGIQLFVFGLARKVLVADNIARIADLAFACEPALRSAPLAWLGAAAYTMQIFLDFSGYSLMAIGLGRMLGFTFPTNFREPLTANSMSDFWKRWHITLTDWFRRYVYIPLGGNRKGGGLTLRNTAIVFILTGIWHGAAWTFVIWGAWNGIFVILERARILRPNGWPKALAHAYTIIIVLIGFIIFRSTDLKSAALYAYSLVNFTFYDSLSIARLLEPLNPKAIVFLIIGIIICIKPYKNRATTPKTFGQTLGQAAISWALLVFSYAAIVSSGYSPFIYFQF